MSNLVEERRQSGKQASTSLEENPAASNAAAILSLAGNTVRPALLCQLAHWRHLRSCQTSDNVGEEFPFPYLYFFYDQRLETLSNEGAIDFFSGPNLPDTFLSEQRTKQYAGKLVGH